MRFCSPLGCRREEHIDTCCGVDDKGTMLKYIRKRFDSELSGWTILQIQCGLRSMKRQLGSLTDSGKA